MNYSDCLRCSGNLGKGSTTQSLTTSCTSQVLRTAHYARGYVVRLWLNRVEYCQILIAMWLYGWCEWQLIDISLQYAGSTRQEVLVCVLVMLNYVLKCQSLAWCIYAIKQKTWYMYSFNPCIIYDTFSTWDFVLRVFCDIFMSEFQLVCAVCSAMHNQLCIKWPLFSCGWYKVAGDCVLVYLTDMKINTQKLEMLSEKN